MGESLKGIIIDWSDLEAKGLHELLGENVVDKVLKRCNLLWKRSYQWVADKVSNNVHRSNRVLAKEAFCAVAKQVMAAKTKEDVLKLFDVLQGEAEISTVQHLLSMPDEHLTVVTHNCDWSSAKTWIQWWIRPKHLQMLSKPFPVMSSSHWDYKHQETQTGWNMQLNWLKVEQVKFICLLLCSHCMKKTRCLLCSIWLCQRSVPKFHIEVHRKMNVMNNLHCKTNENKRTQMQVQILGFLTRMNIFSFHNQKG